MKFVATLLAFVLGLAAGWLAFSGSPDVRLVPMVLGPVVTLLGALAVLNRQHAIWEKQQTLAATQKLYADYFFALDRIDLLNREMLADTGVDLARSGALMAESRAVWAGLTQALANAASLNDPSYPIVRRMVEPPEGVATGFPGEEERVRDIDSRAKENNKRAEKLRAAAAGLDAEAQSLDKWLEREGESRERLHAAASLVQRYRQVNREWDQRTAELAALTEIIRSNTRRLVDVQVKAAREIRASLLELRKEAAAR